MKQIHTRLLISANPVFEGEGLASTVEIAKEISTDVEVLFVNFPMTLMQLRDTSQKLRIRRALGLEKASWNPEGYPNITVLEPSIMLPSNKFKGGLYAIIQRLNNRRYGRSIKRALKQLGWKEYYAVSALNPLYQDAFTKLQAVEHIYYCYDNIAAAKWLADHGTKAEAELVPKVDRIVVSSAGLREKFQGAGKPIHWVPNGMNPADFPLMTKMNYEAVHMAYIGALDDRLDYALMEELLNSDSTYRMTLVGPATAEGAKILSEHPRCNAVGKVPMNEVASHLKECNVGLIPFVKNDFTNFIYPLKINEYLSLGMAVLSTDFADLSPFKGVVRPVSSNEEAIQELQRIQSQDLNKKGSQMRSEFAQKQSWTSRAQQFKSILTDG